VQESIGLFPGLLLLCAIVGTAIYSRKIYEELVELNEKMDELIDRQKYESETPVALEYAHSRR
jgi:hypothetical protein